MVLRKKNRFAGATALLLAGAFMLLVTDGCGLFSPRRGAGGFTHPDHAAQGITCDACHFGSDLQPLGVMPTYRACFACHGPSEHRESYPFEKELQKHSPDAAFVARERHYDLIFSHVVHASKAIHCAECHEDIDADSRLSRSGGPQPAVCESCHRKEGLTSECSLCHSELRKDREPPSHRSSNWMRTHGRTVSLGLDLGHTESCNLCHSQGDCDNCHRVEKPQDHTEYFGERGHGLQVEISRERCMACHQENFCIRCHKETRPRSHTNASFGGQQSNHCLFCHQSLSNSGCFVCHRGTPSHQQATPIPPPPHPSAASDCRQCHLRPPHADNGSDCTICHR